MKILTWPDFNICVQKITVSLQDHNLKGVYGVPRGGLCLAVALSHSLNLPLLDSPDKNILIVDDIYETGKTLEPMKMIPGVKIYVWLSKVKPDWWESIEITSTNEWVVFPWENLLRAEKDRDLYKQKIQG